MNLQEMRGGLALVGSRCVLHRREVQLDIVLSLRDRAVHCFNKYYKKKWRMVF